jgi:predicted phosphodiesterase
MENWLQQDLAQNNQDWTIVSFHQAPYSKGSHDSDDIWEFFMKGMRKYLLPIMDQGGVDLVLSGHSHNYERSYLIKNHYGVGSTLSPNMILDPSSGDPSQGDSYKKYTSTDCNYEGIVYAVMGNSGSKTSPGNDEGLNHPAMYIGDAEEIQKYFKENHLNQVFTHNYTPQENGHIVSFRAILSEKLKPCHFWSIEQLEQVIILFYNKYNNQRLHSSV